MVIMIDNFDSFTFNLVQYLIMLGCEVKVFRNNSVTIEELKELKPSHIVISPGPGVPSKAGISKDVISSFKGIVPVLGVCLGHQAIGEVFGGKIINSRFIMHGKMSSITHKGEGVLKNIQSPFQATRYHSLAVERESFPDVLKITAESEDNEIMALEHRSMPVFGVQFHPESILSENGFDILKNFLKY